MAGGYDDAPGRRMAWDDDGTIAVIWDTDVGGPVYEVSSADKAELNDEDSIAVTPGVGVPASWEDEKHTMAFLFPEDREVDGYWSYRASATYTLTHVQEYAQDTTNGLDGTWVTAGTSLQTTTSTTVIPDYRDEIQASSASAASGWRVTPTIAIETYGNNYWYVVHLYGEISAGNTPDRIIYLDTANSDAEFSAVLDYGDVPRGQTSTRTIKLKNNSASYTINGVSLTAESLYGDAGSWYTFATTELGTYYSTLAVGNITSSGTQIIYCKQIIPDAEDLGVWAGRFDTSHTSLS